VWMGVHCTSAGKWEVCDRCGTGNWGTTVVGLDDKPPLQHPCPSHNAGLATGWVQVEVAGEFEVEQVVGLVRKEVCKIGRG